jgi:hypothetical protein
VAIAAHLPVRRGRHNPPDGRRCPLGEFTVSPTLIVGCTLTERLLPGDVLTGEFAWLDAATGIGLAAGYSAGGLATAAAGPRGWHSWPPPWPGSWPPGSPRWANAG